MESSHRQGWKKSVWPLAALMLAGLAGPALGQPQVHRNSFESQKLCWIKNSADAVNDELAHTITDEFAHDGLHSEYLKLQTKPGAGSYIYYVYGIGKGEITQEFNAGVWVKANRPGVQFLARVILPNETDPTNREFRMSTILKGDAYRQVGRWQQLEIPRPMTLLEKAKTDVAAQLKREVNFTGAYVDSLVLNVYSGQGLTEVWIDHLEVGPVSPLSPIRPVATTANAKSAKNVVVEFNANRLLAGGNRLIFRGVHYSDTPLRVLRDAGFTTLFVDSTMKPNDLQEAADLGFWLVPDVHAVGGDGKTLGNDEVTRSLQRFSDSDAVLFWNLGWGLGREQTDPILRAAHLVSAADSGRPLGADIVDNVTNFSRQINLIGAHRFPLMSSLELAASREWIDQRRRLAHQGAFLWTEIQTHMPDEYAMLLYDRTGHDAFNEPVGPLPEQVRLLTYSALAAGSKGIVYSSDRWLADSHQGRDRLLCCAAINQELEMLEPLLVQVDEPPMWVDTSVPQVRAAVMRTPKGTLVLPIWLGKGSQFVPGQATVSKLSIVVPQVPQSSQAWEIHPADVRSLRVERVTGGLKVTVPEFSLTTAIFFANDTKMVQRFQEQMQSRRQLAAQWSYDMAYYELSRIRKVHDQLTARNQSLPETSQLLTEAENRLRTARQLWESRNFGEAFRESQRALRPVRILMRMEWDKAVKPLDTPVASQYAVSYFTLPRHYEFMELKDRLVATTNVLPGGNFEVIPERSQPSWRTEETICDEVDVLATRVGEVKINGGPKGAKPPAQETPHEGKQCVMLQMKPRGKGPAPAALEKSRISLISPTIRLQAGTIVQVSGWVRVPSAIEASPDGAMLYDSAGGEELAVRFTGTMPWKKFTLYRRVPVSGNLNVTLALTGLGTIYFDDIRVEPLVAPGPNGPNGAPVANR